MTNEIMSSPIALDCARLVLLCLLAALTLVATDLRALQWLPIVFIPLATAPERLHNALPWLGLRSSLGFDTASLAALRISLGVGVLLDLWHRSGVFSDFYTDDGMMPRDVYLGLCRKYEICDYEYPATRGQQSVHLMGGTAFTQASIWTLHTICALSLMVGYRTSQSAMLSWFLTESLHMRLHWANDKGAMTLRTTLFWAMQLPLGTVGSVDSALAKPWAPRASSSHPLLCAATVALCAQMTCLYWFSMLYKWRVPNSEWRDGTAMEYALGMVNYRTTLGAVLLDFPIVLFLSTHGGTFAECFAPFLLCLPLLSPSASRWVRGFAALFFVGFHMTIHLTLDIGIFPLLSCLPFVAFVPGEVWKRVAVSTRVAELPEALLSWWKGARLPGTRDEPPQQQEESRPSSRRRGLIALGCLLRYARHLFCVSSLAYMVAWNLGEYDHAYRLPLRGVAREWGALLGLRQHWKLFTNIRPGDGGYEDCRVMVGGVLASNESSVIDFMEWRRNRMARWTWPLNLIAPDDSIFAAPDGFVIPRDSEQPLEACAVTESENNEQSWERVLCPGDKLNGAVVRTLNDTAWRVGLTTPVVAYVDYAHYLWKTLLLAIRHIDPAVRQLGHFVCAEWNVFPVELSVTIDGVARSLVITPSMLDPAYGGVTMASAVGTFCSTHHLEQASCQVLLEAAERAAKKRKMTDWVVFSVCDGRISRSYYAPCENSIEDGLTEWAESKLRRVNIEVPGLR